MKNALLKINFCDEGHLYANLLIFVLTIYRKCLLFQFFSRGIQTHITNLTGFQKKRIICQKNSHILLKTFFWRSLVWELLVLYSDYLP